MALGPGTRLGAYEIISAIGVGGSVRSVKRVVRKLVLAAIAPLMLASVSVYALSEPFLVKDINPGRASSSPDAVGVVGGTLFFVASDGVSGFELWKTDGTEPGTLLVKDINAGIAGSELQPMGVIGQTLFFAASDGVNGLELWKSDGTETGTVLVKDINPGSASSSPGAPAVVGETLFFRAFDSRGFELWKSDGTEAGTVLVKDIYPGFLSSFATALVVVDQTLFSAHPIRSVALSFGKPMAQKLVQRW